MMNDKLSHITDRKWLQARHFLPLVRQHAEATRGTLLDLGCGASPFRPLFTAATRYLRIDRYPVDEDIIVADVENLPLAVGPVDVVLLSQVMGDFPDVVSALQEIARVMSPGGKMLVYETMTYPQHDLPNDHWRVMPNGLRWAAGKAGLEVQSVNYLGGYFTQLSMHWNTFLLGPLEKYTILKPIVLAGRACGNLLFAALDTMFQRPELASDYFACVVKPVATDKSREASTP